MPRTQNSGQAPTPQYLSPLGKVNLLAGKNNAGKSNVLRALPLLATFEFGVRKPKHAFDPTLDYHIGSQPATPIWHFPLYKDAASVTRVIDGIVKEAGQRQHWYAECGKLLNLLSPETSDAVWFSFDPIRESQLIGPDAIEAGKRIENLPLSRTWSSLWSTATGTSGGSFRQHAFPELLSLIARQAVPQFGPVLEVGAHRQVGEPNTEYKGLNGAGLIARLLALQNPELSQRQDYEKFEKINDFLRIVVDSPSARLEVPHSGRQLLVKLDGRLLPIQSLGTGIHQVIIFAAAATTHDNSILCIEEPEVHLHPRLQRKLLAYLQERTTNQYFIATHSASLLDASGVRLFHVSLDQQGATKIHGLDVPDSRARVCFDLGYQASDLVQANAVVWVEGPSDRIYVRAWLAAAAPDLVEGLHYSIMFYGGRLLSHLSADDKTIGDFISLQRLNRNVAIIVDSDKRTPRSRINATKKRVVKELTGSGGFAWVTRCREIENFISSSAMRAALAAVHPKLKFAPRGDEWTCAYELASGQVGSVDKIAVARHATKSIDLGVLDLKAKVDDLVAFIRTANI